MKRILTLFYLCVSVSAFSQTIKRDWVVTPTVGWNTVNIDYTTEKDILSLKLPTVVYNYLSDKFAIGYGLAFNYNSLKSYSAMPIEFNSTEISFIPEARYNILKSRFTPYVSGKIGSVGYFTRFIDNSQMPTPISLRRNSDLYLICNFELDIGVSYFIKDRFGLQLKLMTLDAGLFDTTNLKVYTPINFGLQFIINK